MSHGTAAIVRRQKDIHPERYCTHPNCLWATRSGTCPKHPVKECCMCGVEIGEGLERVREAFGLPGVCLSCAQWEDGE